ncbi:AraC family transcriptional regulator [Pararcticibacter amylolyticus]|uniref:AraC family transcriptional regulator n=1 Tax=Pararcticibacter amylolyticus TaxID=2173175 RepID=A0A2U2PJN1_9SPHI|nr:helix-turn-helix transcriptional regulator [Pararcticibacter amylolyticus]PWG81616.1 AraC family transcriptional regulator [Pararcticibacter amylolyticus]
MKKKTQIPVHSMDDWFSGVYIQPMGVPKNDHPVYEMSQPHRHDFYQCVLVDKGEMEMEVDFEKVRLSDRDVFLSYPGQIHHIVSSRMQRGWFLAFDPATLDANLRSILDQFLTEIMLIQLSQQQSKNFYSLMHHLYQIYKDPGQLYQQQALQAMTCSVIYQLSSTYLREERSTLGRHSFRNVEITKTFRELLRHHDKSLKNTSQFAARMNITASHLNDTVKSVTGFPVTYHIQQELIREARRLLCFSDRTIMEIAGTLGFDDVKYFTRLFSKVTGVAPGKYRKAFLVSR